VRAQTPDYAAMASRIAMLTPPEGQRMLLPATEVPVEILGLGHGTRHGDIQNLGHIVTIGGRKVLHVGDADPSTGVFETLNLDEAGIDIALLPVWFLTDFAPMVKEHIKPRHIIAVHMAGGAAALNPRAVQAFPDAVPFVRFLEKRYY
jgi:L-ascorbate metabolism protein UlaG (beta-lactamase superfamily)